MTNLLITALHAHAALLIEVTGTATARQLRTEADKITALGADRGDVEQALFQVSNLVNVTV